MSAKAIPKRVTPRQLKFGSVPRDLLSFGELRSGWAIEEEAPRLRERNKYHEASGIAKEQDPDRMLLFLRQRATPGGSLRAGTDAGIFAPKKNDGTGFISRG
jgi:hypothetical protein